MKERFKQIERERETKTDRKRERQTKTDIKRKRGRPKHINEFICTRERK